MKDDRIRKPFKYEGYFIDKINMVISLYILCMFLAIVVGIGWRMKYMFLITGAGVLLNISAIIKFKKQRRIWEVGAAGVFAGILLILCLCDVFRFVF